MYAFLTLLEELLTDLTLKALIVIGFLLLVLMFPWWAPLLAEVIKMHPWGAAFLWNCGI